MRDERLVERPGIIRIREKLPRVPGLFSGFPEWPLCPTFETTDNITHCRFSTDRCEENTLISDFGTHIQSPTMTAIDALAPLPRLGSMHSVAHRNGPTRAKMNAGAIRTTAPSHSPTAAAAAAIKTKRTINNQL